MTSVFFERVFDTRGGSLVQECACGRVHYNSHREDIPNYEKGEFARLETARKKDPDKYFAKNYSIGTMEIPFIGEIVFDCPCRNADKAEEIIRRYGPKLAEYLNGYAESLRKKADEVEVKDKTNE
jgi:hypothetical protein